jgi:hypothetical protein
MEMPAAVTGKDWRPIESTVGSGQFETPWFRMHWANLRPSVSACWTTAGGLPGSGYPSTLCERRDGGGDGRWPQT